MSDLLSIGLSGMVQSQNRMADAANNISKLGQKQDSPEGTSNANLARDMVTLTAETNFTKANAAVVKTGDELAKTTIDLIA